MPTPTPDPADRAEPAQLPPHRGAAAEELAAQYLRLRGAQVLARNVRGGGGEIDLVVRDGSALVFVEVRLRGAGAWCAAPASVGRQKQRRMRACARWVLHRRRELTWPGCTYRFDVIAVQLHQGGLRLSHLYGVRLDG